MIITCTVSTDMLDTTLVKEIQNDENYYSTPMISSDASDNSSSSGGYCSNRPAHFSPPPPPTASPKQDIIHVRFNDNDNDSGTSICRNRKPSRSSLVTFSHVEVRSFPIILGDNPACCDGPPLTIDWDPMSCHKIQLDKYENIREERGIKSTEELRISGFFRQILLRRSGVCTKEEILSRMEEMEKVRKQRNKTKLIYLFKLKLKRLLFRKKSRSSGLGNK